MSALKKISDRFGHFDDWHHVNKFSLVLIVVIFAAIPLTVFTAITLRQVNPQAYSNPYIAYNLKTTPISNCIPDTTRPGMYKVNVRFEWNPADYAIAATGQKLEIGTNLGGPFYGSSVLGKKTIDKEVNKEQTLYWRINTGYSNGAWAASTAVRVNNTCTVVPTLQPPKILGLSETYGRGVTITWDNPVGAVRYEVEKSTDTQGSTTSPAYTNSFFEGNLTPGVLYKYKVRAVDSAGKYSAFSNIVQNTGLATDTDRDGFYDSEERNMGTNVSLACGANAWPPDLNDNKAVNSSDQLLMAQRINAKVYVNRFDLYGDGVLDAKDQNEVGRYNSKFCS